MNRRLFTGAILLLLACGGDDPLPAPTIDASLVGTWQIRKVNGQPLPYLLSQSGTTKTELSGGSITTAATGTFTTQMNTVTTSSGAISLHLDPDNGTFTVDGSQLTFHFSKAGTTAIGTFSHDTLTVVEGSLSLALTR